MMLTFSRHTGTSVCPDSTASTPHLSAPIRSASKSLQSQRKVPQIAINSNRATGWGQEGGQRACQISTRCHSPPCPHTQGIPTGLTLHSVPWYAGNAKPPTSVSADWNIVARLRRKCKAAGKSWANFGSGGAAAKSRREKQEVFTRVTLVIGVNPIILYAAKFSTMYYCLERYILISPGVWEYS